MSWAARTPPDDTRYQLCAAPHQAHYGDWLALYLKLVKYEQASDAQHQATTVTLLIQRVSCDIHARALSNLRSLTNTTTYYKGILLNAGDARVSSEAPSRTVWFPASGRAVPELAHQRLRR